MSGIVGGQVVAAYLMAKEGLTAKEALEAMQQVRPFALPNAGFLAQLDAWENMKCQPEPSHPYFKRRQLESLSKQRLESGGIDKQALALPSQAITAQENLYRCRKCRRLLATSSNVVSSTSSAASPDPTGFSHKRMSKVTEDTLSDETQLFVEPMQWMEEVVEGNVQGKLYCPSCKARLGSFNWSGMQNARGAWVTPAFQLQLARLDAVAPTLPANTRIQQPVLV